MTTTDFALSLLRSSTSDSPCIAAEAAADHRMVPSWPDAAAEDAVIRENRARFDVLLASAESAAAAGEWDCAAAWAQVAAHSAWFAHPGIVVSPELEDLLLRLATGAFGADISTNSRRRGSALAEGRPQTVLYVFTETYDIGGHTRQAYRTIGRDDARPVVVLTQQRGPVPEALVAAAAAKGGLVYRLPGGSGGLLERARTVRRLAQGVDVVVVSAHPYDVVPALALCGGDTPPVITMNHADHAFWVGLAATEVVSDHRMAGLRFTRTCRGVGEAHGALVPLPIDPLPTPQTADGVRAALGLPDDAVLAVSVASGHKTQPLVFAGLLDVLVPLAARLPRLHVLAVGPEPDPAWADAARVTGGRLRAVGTQPDVGPLLAAADLYLDSTPVGSGTSILEAAIAGVPPISLFPFDSHGDLMGANSPGLASGHTLVRSQAALAEAVVQMLEDPEHRRHLGEQARASVLAVHSGAAWDAALRQSYRMAAAANRLQPQALSPEAPPSDYNRIVLGLNRNAGCLMPLELLVGRHEDLLQDLGPPQLLPAVPASALSAALAGASRPTAEQVDAALRIEAPEVMAGTPSARHVGGVQPPTPTRYTAVVPAGWESRPGELAAVLSELFHTSPDLHPSRVILPIASAEPAAVGLALAVADRVVRDLGANPHELPFEIAIGDDPPGLRGSDPRLVLVPEGSARRATALMDRWLQRHTAAGSNEPSQRVRTSTTQVVGRDALDHRGGTDVDHPE